MTLIIDLVMSTRSHKMRIVNSLEYVVPGRLPELQLLCHPWKQHRHLQVSDLCSMYHMPSWNLTQQ